MKVAFIVLSLAMAASASPVQTKAVDWDAVEAKVNELHQLVLVTLNSVVEIAKADNAEVGAEIEAIIASHTPAALDILAKALAEVEAETLTVAGAEVYFDQLLAILQQVRDDLTDSVAQLSEAAAKELTETLIAGLMKAEAIAHEIYALLAQ